MADVLALEYLYTAVKARFEIEQPTVENTFGWRAPDVNAIKPRIAWIPGDPSSNVGKLGPARNPGRNPRPLATLYELFTVEVSSADTSALEDELKQYRAARLLFDAWVRAVHLAAHGTYTVESDSWLTEKKVRRYGAAIRAICTIQSMIPDAVAELAPVDAHAVIDVHELDHTETFDTADP